MQLIPREQRMPWEQYFDAARRCWSAPVELDLVAKLMIFDFWGLGRTPYETYTTLLDHPVVRTRAA